MKFIDIKGTQEIFSIEIRFPKEAPGFKYYYPDGVTKGFFKRKTYFIEEVKTLRYDRSIYYETPEKAIKGRRTHLYFVNSGKIWEFGIVKLTFRNQEEVLFTFKDNNQLVRYFENLSFRWGIDLGGYVCLENENTDSLYELKNRNFIEN